MLAQLADELFHGVRASVLGAAMSDSRRLYGRGNNERPRPVISLTGVNCSMRAGAGRSMAGFDTGRVRYQETSPAGTSVRMALSDLAQQFDDASAALAVHLEGRDMMNEDLSIASFTLPTGMRELCVGERGAPPHVDHPLDMQVFHIRMANTAGRREAASLLIRKMYGWRGYAVDGATGQEANKITLYVETGGVMVGTMSLCLDSPSKLPADENFPCELNVLREQGRRLCEPSRLAIDKGVTKRVFASLIHISYIYAHNIHGFTDYIIEVNPRHVMFYKRMLGFDDFGAERDCSRVGAPAVLLRLPLSVMGAQIRRWGGLMEQHGEERSFYPYFFPSWDEPGITARLVAGHR